MQTIKFLPDNQIKLANKTYKGYYVGELPARFAFIYNEDKDQEGINSWFNYKGLTYVEKTISPW